MFHLTTLQVPYQTFYLFYLETRYFWLYDKYQDFNDQYPLLQRLKKYLRLFCLNIQTWSIFFLEKLAIELSKYANINKHFINLSNLLPQFTQFGLLNMYNWQVSKITVKLTIKIFDRSQTFCENTAFLLVINNQPKSKLWYNYCITHLNDWIIQDVDFDYYRNQ